MARKRIMVAALSGMFLLIGYNRENPAKKYATQENFVKIAEGRSYGPRVIEFQDEEILCDGLRYERNKVIGKAVEMVGFSPVTDEKPIETLEESSYIAEVGTDKNEYCFRLYPDLIHARFYSSIGGHLHTAETYSSYQTLKAEDGKHLSDVIKKAYKNGTPRIESKWCYR